MRDAMLIWDSIFAVYSANKAHLNEFKSKSKHNSNDSVGNDTHSLEVHRRTDFRFVDYFGVAMLMFIRHQCMYKFVLSVSCLKCCRVLFFVFYCFVLV